MGKHRILIVDDDEKIHTLLKTILTALNCEMLSAYGAEGAYEMLEKQQFDLIFLDLKMPEVDGIDVLIKLREGGLNVPIYLMSSFQELFEERMLSLTIKDIKYDFLKKPFTSSNIEKIITDVLG